MIRNPGLCRFAIAAIALPASFVAAASHAQRVLTRHVREVTQTGEVQPIGRLPATQTLSLDFVLPLGDPDGLQTFLGEIADPNSSSFGQYLTPAEFTARFGPTQAQFDELVRFAETNGLTVTGGSRDGMDVQINATVSAIERALHINLLTYPRPTQSPTQNPEDPDPTFFAADREPTLDLSFDLWHISGLDNFSLPHPLYVRRSDYAATHNIAPEAVVSHAATGSGPSGSFLGSDMRAAYYGAGSLTGTGQNMGLFEYQGTDLTDLSNYYKSIRQSEKITPVLLSVDGTSTACVDSKAGGKCDDTEQTLDMTQALGMAPGLASLVVYIGSSDTAIVSAMTTHNPLPATIGCSWGWTPADPTTLDPFFEKMAAQGQNFFAASGDNSTWSKSNQAWPADDAYVVSVGGTDLVTDSPGGEWKSETAWTGSGGGISPDKIAIPAWQKLPGVITSTNKGSTTWRNGPDVSANANFTFYTCSDQTTCVANEYGGTSFAAPMWAAYMALVNQQRVADRKARLGFINPILYPENLTTPYATGFHDITTGTSGSYSAEKGYDLVTGWGSPNTGLLDTLATH